MDKRQTHKRYSLTKLSVVVPTSICPSCGSGIDRAVGVNAKEGLLTHAFPQSGDYTVCLMCAAWLVYGSNLAVHVPTVDELLDMTMEQRSIMHAITRTIKARERQ